jgi:hypothetical protein
LDVKSPDYGFALQQMLQRIVDLWVLLPVVALGILLAFPEAESELDSGWRPTQEPSHPQSLSAFQDRHDLFLNSVAEFACLARFAGNFNDSRIHDSLLSVGEKCRRNVAQEARRPLFC